MSLDPETRDQAYQFFVAEAPELLQSIESGLLTLREDYNTAKVHSIMRAAHSIKGGAAGVGLDGIKSLAHRLEDIFKALYHAEDKITPEFERKLLQAYDCLQKPLTEQIETGSYDAETALANAESILSDIEETLGDAMKQGEDYIPGSEDLGVDMASSIFEVDVEQGLEHLKEVMANPNQYEVLGEVRAQAEVFTGLAEIMGLEGFGEIVDSTMKALDTYPQEAVTIGRLMVRDLEAGREAFLSGDRDRGGEPSAELLAYTESTPDSTLEIEETPDADSLFADGEEVEETPDADSLFADEEEVEETPDADSLFADEEVPESLEEAVESLQENFEELPTAQDLNTTPVP